MGCANCGIDRTSDTRDIGDGEVEVCRDCAMMIDDAESRPRQNCWNNLETEIRRALDAKSQYMRVTQDAYEMLCEVSELMALEAPRASDFDELHPDGFALLVIPTRELAVNFLRIHVRDCIDEGIFAQRANLIISPLAMLSLLDSEFVAAYKMASELSDADETAEGAAHAEEARS